MMLCCTVAHWAKCSSLFVTISLIISEHKSSEVLTVLCSQLNQKLRESTEEQEPPKLQTCTDVQPSQEMVKIRQTHTQTVLILRL